MDLLDKKILNELLLDSRQSWNSLSKKLNISPHILKKRITTLEGGVIEGYITDINAKFFMEGFVFVYLKTSSSKEVDIQRALARINQLNYLYLIQDITNNFGLLYEFSNLREKKQLISFLESIPLVSSFEIHQFSYSKAPLPRGIKDVEWKIISLLKNNSRLPGTKLSEITGLNASKVNYVINKLVKDEIIVFTVKMNPLKIKDSTMNFLLLNLKKWDTRFYEICLSEVRDFPLFNPSVIPFSEPPSLLINLLGKMNEIQDIINNLCNSPLISSFTNIIWKKYEMGHSWQDLLIDKKIKSLRIREHFSY